MAKIAAPRGDTPLRHIEALGLLDAATVCIHAVWLDAEDITILRESGAHVVVCPQSNCKLSSGVAPVIKMLRAGVNIGLGTDGCASNNSLDMFREMDILAKLHKVTQGDATALPARCALRCATTKASRAAEHSPTGEIAVGNRADLILVNLRAPHLTPFYNQDLLVYAAKGSDVATVIIDGKCVMREREILSVDMEETLRTVEKLAEKLASARRENNLPSFQ